MRFTWTRRISVAVTLGLVTFGAAVTVRWFWQRPFTALYEELAADDAVVASSQVMQEADARAPLTAETGAPAADEAAAPLGTAAAAPLASSATERPSLAEPGRFQTTENTLFLGFDRHRGVRRGGSTDTILVAVYDEPAERLGVISVPRDLYVEIPGHGKNRINAVYGLATLERLKPDGVSEAPDPLALTQRVIADTLGIPIHHSVAIDLGVFERLIDELGGVTVNVQCPIEDNFIDSRTETGRRSLSLQVGPQRMDGPTAAMFVRSRHGRSDWSRTRRQQQVLMSVKDELGSVSGLLRVPRLFEQVEGSIVTRMSRFQVLDLAGRLLRVPADRVHGIVFGHTETVPYRTEKKWSVLLPDQSAIQGRLENLFSEAPPGAEPRGAICPPADVALARKARSGPAAGPELPQQSVLEEK